MFWLYGGSGISLSTALLDAVAKGSSGTGWERCTEMFGIRYDAGVEVNSWWDNERRNSWICGAALVLLVFYSGRHAYVELGLGCMLERASMVQVELPLRRETTPRRKLLFDKRSLRLFCTRMSPNISICCSITRPYT